MLYLYYIYIGRTEAETNQRPKTLQEEYNLLPDIFVETPSTATLMEESSTVNRTFYRQILTT